MGWNMTPMKVGDRVSMSSKDFAIDIPGHDEVLFHGTVVETREQDGIQEVRVEFDLRDKETGEVVSEWFGCWHLRREIGL